MPEPRRLDAPAAIDTVDRDSRIEQLLVDGLDHYFRGQYDEAIHLWTRVLFLDRAHARARAYTDRARTALAERQRRADEMIHAGSELLAQGRTDQARHLLTQAVAASGEDEHASALRVKLERVERASNSVRPVTAVAPAGPAVPGWVWPRRSRTALLVGSIVLGGALISIGVTDPVVQDFMGIRSPQAPSGLASRDLTRPSLLGAEVALIRARTLYSRGRLAEALLTLDRVDLKSAFRSDADRLRVEIQQLLLASGRGPAPSSRGVDPGRR
jgi:tetratricopeptide (TPR) repeat protein